MSNPIRIFHRCPSHKQFIFWRYLEDLLRQSQRLLMRPLSFFLFLVLENYFYLRCQFMTRVHFKLASSKFCSKFFVLKRKIARFGSNLCSWNPFSNFSCPSPNVYSPLCERFTFVWDCNQVRNLLLKSFCFLTGYFTHFISKAQYLNSIFDNSDMQFFVMGLLVAWHRRVLFTRLVLNLV